MYKDGVVVAGSLDGLISLLLPSQTHQIEVGVAMGVVFSNELSSLSPQQQSYVFAFVLCSRLFIQPHQLLGRVTKVSVLFIYLAYLAFSLLMSVCLSVSVHVQIFSSLQKQQPSSSTVSAGCYANHRFICLSSPHLQDSGPANKIVELLRYSSI